MNDLRRRLGIVLALFLLMATVSFAQRDTKKRPLTEEAISKLVKSDLEDEVIAALIKKRGISFTADEDSLKRLKKAGAGAAALDAVRATSPKEKLSSEDSEKQDAPTVLATEKHEKKLIVEVTEVKPDADRPLLTIRWRYRNPTKRTIQLFGEGPTFVIPAKDNERWVFVNAIYFLAGGSEDEKQFRHSVVKDTGGKSWCKQIGKKPVQIAPGEEYEFWAKFDLPAESTKKIGLQLEEVPLMEGIPIQWGATK